MSTTNPTVETVWRCLRYGYRVPMLLCHVAILLMVVVPLIVLGRGGRLSHAAIRNWAGGLVWIFGLRVHRVGSPRDGGTLFVANHISWIDILVLDSQHMMAFIAKSEIRNWPLIGFLAKCGESMFLQRGNGDSLGIVVSEMAQRLRAGRAVAAFPEGGTRNGQALGTFHARIFAAAVDADAPVQPVALCYGVGCAAQPVVAFARGEGFMGNLVRLLAGSPLTVRVQFGEPIFPATHDGRRSIAAAAQAQVERAMAQA